MAEYNKAQLTEMIVGKLLRNFGRTVDEATPNHMFKACAGTQETEEGDPAGERAEEAPISEENQSEQE